MPQVDTVKSSADSKDRTLRCRVIRNTSTAAKAPVYRVLVTLPGVLSLATLSFPIFADKDAQGGIKGFSVAMPGGSFPAMEPIKASIEKDGTNYWLADPTDEASALTAKLLEQVKGVAMAYHAGNGKVPAETTINL